MNVKNVLNYCVIMFVFCVLLMITVSLLTEKPDAEQISGLTFSRKTMSVGVEKVWVWIHAGLSVLVVSIIVSIWAHFA